MAPNVLFAPVAQVRLVLCYFVLLYCPLFVRVGVDDIPTSLSLPPPNAHTCPLPLNPSHTLLHSGAPGCSTANLRSEQRCSGGFCGARHQQQQQQRLQDGEAELERLTVNNPHGPLSLSWCGAGFTLGFCAALCVTAGERKRVSKRARRDRRMTLRGNSLSTTLMLVLSHQGLPAAAACRRGRGVGWDEWNDTLQVESLLLADITCVEEGRRRRFYAFGKLD